MVKVRNSNSSWLFTAIYASPRTGMGGSEESLVGFHGGTVEGGMDV